jgi:hypothetical protein
MTDELKNIVAACPAVSYAQGLQSTTIPLNNSCIIYTLWQMPSPSDNITLKDQEVDSNYILGRFEDQLYDMGFLGEEGEMAEQVAQSLAKTLNMRVAAHANLIRHQISITKELLQNLADADMISAYIGLIALKNSIPMVEGAWMYGWQEWGQMATAYVLDNATTEELQQMEDLL